MASRIGPGPVFVYESLIFARRRQIYAGRMLFVLALLLGLWAAWWSNLSSVAFDGWGEGSPGVLQALARAGQAFFSAMAGIQLAMVLLVAPSATAGAICHDRARGILAQMATTDLSAAEIVLGKLGSRLAPILALLACALPVTALAALLGGVDIQALFSLFVVSAAVAVLGCALAMAISVHAARTQEVIMAVLALWTAWLLSLPIWWSLARPVRVPDWFYKANPFVLVYAPYSWPGYVGPLDVALFVAGALVVSAGLAGLAIARLRRALLPREAVRRARKGGILSFRLPSPRRWLAWLPGPSLDGNPVLWREWHRGRPSRLARVIWVAYWLGSIVGLGIGVAEAIQYGTNTPRGGLVLILSLVLQSSLGLMLLSSQAPASLGEERARGSLDVLMTTPISTRAILWGKWLGTYRIVFWVAILPGSAATVLAWTIPPTPWRYRSLGIAPPDPTILDFVARLPLIALTVAEPISYGAAITSLGLLLATWIPRPGRAIAINVAVFVLIAVGWPFIFVCFILDPLRAWLIASWNMAGADMSWINWGPMAISPLVAPVATLNWIDEPWSGARWKFWVFALAWCLLAWTLAGAMFWAALKSFDRRLGRMRETSAGAMADESPRLAPVGAGRQNEDR